MKHLKIEMIHDVVCSWCHIGYHNIQVALDRLSDDVKVEFHFLPFQLNPGLNEEGVDITDHLRERNQWSLADALSYRESLLETTRQMGVTIDFSKRTRYYNTASAHRLLLVAENAGQQQQMHQALMQAYHVEGENISNLGVLINIAEQIGFDIKTVEQALFSVTIDRQIQALSQRVKSFTVKSVPAFIFNDHHVVSGSNSANFFEQLIRSEFLIDNTVEEKSQCLM